MKIVTEDEGMKLAESDSPWLGAHALIFKSRVLGHLGDMLREFGELLPISCAGEDLHIYNPMRVVDALDEERSSLLRFKSGRLMGVTKYVLRASAVQNVDVFKIPNLRVSPTFFSGRFVDAWNAAGLVGLNFDRIAEYS
jgi:hypothetical protein